MYVRTSTIEVPPDKLDAAILHFKEVTLPEVRKLPGWEGIELGVDRDNGILRVIAYWSSREQLDSATEVTNNLRNQFVTEGRGTRVASVEVYEIVVREGQGSMAKAA